MLGMTIPSKCKLFLLYFSAAVLLAGCGGQFPFAQPLEVEQGNLLEDEDIARVEEGMSRADVRRILGEPVLEHAFAENRWDYLYERRGSEEQRKRLTLFFEDDTVVEIEDRWTER